MHRLIPILLAAALALPGCTTTGTRVARGNADALDNHTRVEARGAPALAMAKSNTLADTTRGDMLTVERTLRTRHSDRDSTNPPPTAGQRVAAIVGTFSGFGLIAILLLAVFCPGVIAAFFVRAAMRWRAAFTETVAAIHHSKAVSSDIALHDALLAAQSPTTRQLVEVARRDA